MFFGRIVVDIRIFPAVSKVALVRIKQQYTFTLENCQPLWRFPVMLVDFG